MAPGDESHSEREASAAHNTATANPAAGDAAQNAGNDGPNKAKQGRGRHKGRGEKGRNDWNRDSKRTDRREKIAEKRKKQQQEGDWRDFKRRKLGEDGEPLAKNPFSKDEIAAEGRKPKRKVAVMIGYAGTGYKGMQVNGDEHTIERDLFKAFIEAGAISKANADDPRKSSLARCARTDKGVHAAGNVISLKLIIEEEDVVDKINEALPPQIRVWGIQRTNNAYNCYQTCDSRWYEYLLPSYCLLPPHPRTYLAGKVEEQNKEQGKEEEAAARMADVSSFWADVEEKYIQPIIERLEPEVRAVILDRALSGDESATSNDKQNKEEGEKPKPTTEENSNDETPKEPATNDDKNQKAEGEEDNGQTTTLPSTKPKNRELNAVDFALRDIKAAYINAKRSYRITPERMQQLQDVLTKYVGTHNFHNYTVEKAFSDPSAKRHIKSFQVNPKPIIIGNTEWLSLKVHGQSFMMHQIRKMVGMAALSVRCGTTLDRVEESYQKKKMAIPKAPGLGLLLERPVFDNYNRKARDELGRQEIDFDTYGEKLEEFKNKEIYQRIFEVEERDNSFHAFFSQIDQFKSNHFLWLTAGGLGVAEIAKGSKAQDVDKELGDEDEEDPEGGEG